MTRPELGVIGGGNMAVALLRGLLAGGLLPPGEVVVSEPDEARRSAVGSLGVVVTGDNVAAARSRRVLLAVKPQVMAAVLGQIGPHVAAEALVISIAAGVSGRALDAGLGGRGRIVRVMPNTPMLVGAGMSGVAAGPRATPADVEWVLRLCRSAGEAVAVDESLMDAVTAVSGSGPAYFFYLAEAMIRAGVAEGLDEPTARRLAAQTCMGAGTLLCQGGDPAELRRQVTSPGGTTQAAIEAMERAGVGHAATQAVRAAAARSRQLGNT